MGCNGQCSGCALRPGSHANVEVNNRLKAALAALGGIPFHCHERLGWTPDREGQGYPHGEATMRADIVNLMTAPRLIHDSPELAAAISDATATGLPASMFAKNRERMGKNPTCEGWRAAVGDLGKQNWFNEPEVRKYRRVVASEAIRQMDAGIAGKPEAFDMLDRCVQFFRRELKAAKVKFNGFK